MYQHADYHTVVPCRAKARQDPGRGTVHPHGEEEWRIPSAAAGAGATTAGAAIRLPAGVYTHLETTQVSLLGLLGACLLALCRLLSPLSFCTVLTTTLLPGVPLKQSRRLIL